MASGRAGARLRNIDSERNVMEANAHDDDDFIRHTLPDVVDLAISDSDASCRRRPADTYPLSVSRGHQGRHLPRGSPERVEAASVSRKQADGPASGTQVGTGRSQARRGPADAI